MDKLLPHKEALQKHLKKRFGELFNIDYDLLLYDITSTYFAGQAASNPQAKRGYSRDQRPDCKQVCIALVVTKEGIPLGYEVFDGNRHDSTTVQEIVEKMEESYGAAGRIWVMDRGMVSEENVEFLSQNNRRYIIGTPKILLSPSAASDDCSSATAALPDSLTSKSIKIKKMTPYQSPGVKAKTGKVGSN